MLGTLFLIAIVNINGSTIFLKFDFRSVEVLYLVEVGGFDRPTLHKSSRIVRGDFRRDF
jgi:hypothetical protein